MTFAGLAGMGDLLATCISPQSRNRYVGEQLGKGRSIDEIIAEMNQVAEGVKSCRTVLELAESVGVEMPIVTEVVGVVHGGRTANDALPRADQRHAGAARTPSRLTCGHEPAPPLGCGAHAHARRGADRSRLGVAVLARAATRPDLACVHAARSLVLPHERHCSQLDACRQRRLAVGGDRRPSRPRHDVVRRLVARLVDRRRGRLARPVAGAAVARSPTTHRRVTGGGDVAPRARRPCRAPRVRVLHGPGGQRRVRDGHRRDREPQPGPVRRRPRRPAVQPGRPRRHRAHRSARRHDRDRRRSRRDAAAQAAGAGRGVDVPRRATARRSCWRTVPVPARSRPGCGTKREWRKPRSSIRCRTRPRCGWRCRWCPTSRTRRRGRTRRRVERAPTFPTAIPSAEQVARGWAAQSRRRHAPRAARPAPAGGGRRQPPLPARACTTAPTSRPARATHHRFWFRDAAFLLAALDRYGFHSQVAEVLRSYPARQRADGLFFSQSQRMGRERLRAVVDRRALAAHSRRASWSSRWSDRSPRARSGSIASAGRSGGAGPSCEGCFPPASRPSTSARSTTSTGTTSGAPPACGRPPSCWLRSARPDASAQARRDADALWADTVASLDVVSRRLGSDAIPGGPRRTIDAGVIGSLVACEPLRLLPSGDRRIAATLDVVRERFSLGDAFFQASSHTGLGDVSHDAGGRSRACPRRPPRARSAGMAARRRRPRRGRGPKRSIRSCPAGAWATATTGGRRRRSCRSCATCSCGRCPPTAGTAPWPGLALCSLLPDEWLGQGFEVHDAPTHFGTMSYAVRWHGARPALLWELVAHDDIDGVQLTAPGLDPDWSTTERSGEALLSAPERGALSG